MDHLCASLVSKSLGFHGQPLQKIWEGERGENDLTRIGVTNPDFTTYQTRQKYLTFQDRAKRLRLHQFIAKKANELFDASLVEEVPPNGATKDKIDSGASATMVPYESFLKLDNDGRTRHFYDNIQRGDIIYGTIISKTASGMVLKVLCTIGTVTRYVADIRVKAYLPTNNTIPAIDKKNATRSYCVNDIVCCEIQEVIPDTDKMVVVMKTNSRYAGSTQHTMGLIQPENLPEFYKIAEGRKDKTFDELLESSPGFTNPYCIDYLSSDLGLVSTQFYTNMSNLRGRFPQQEYANELRQVQASKWAFRSVAEGIEHFKEGRHSEAFQCLNKALSIDPRNVEGLVARGALYANSGSFKKAVEDFETALKLNPSHANARKYMGETLVALGRSYEEENKIDEARKAYQDCLSIIPHHEEAQNSLEFLKSKLSVAKPPLIEPAELVLPALNFNNKQLESNKMETEGVIIKKDMETRNKDKKNKKKKGKNRKRYSSSSSESSISSESSETSSESSSGSESSSSSESDSNSRRKKKRQGRSEKTRQKSLSPLSKRMALMGDSNLLSAGGSGPSVGGSGVNAEFQFNQPYGQASDAPPPPIDDYEMKVRKFLEITRDEDNYEEKVRKFVEEASKYRKERKMLEEKVKKKKKKEAKRLKKESRKKRKEKDRDEKKKSKSGKKDKLDLEDSENKKLREALRIFERLPVLDELGSKLSSIIGKSDKISSIYDDEEMKGGKQRRQSPDKDLTGGKWKMMFAKDERRKTSEPTTAAPSTSKNIPKQYAFSNDSDDSLNDPQTLGYPIAPPAVPPPQQQSSEKKRKFSSSPFGRNKYNEPPPPLPPKPVVKSGPIVLDKFGNFRLAAMETNNPNNKPPEPPRPPKKSRSRSRSRSGRKYSSSSRSRSRSPRRRSRSGSYPARRSRSRSRSYRSRSGSRSRSKSYSRSRSRSRSVDRRRYDRRTYRGRGYERGTYYKPRFNNHPRGNRGRGGNYRDNRDFRGRGRDRPFRPRGRGGPRYYRGNRDDSRERRYDRRSRERSDERDRRSYSDERPRSPIDDGKDNYKPDMEKDKNVSSSNAGVISANSGGGGIGSGGGDVGGGKGDDIFIGGNDVGNAHNTDQDFGRRTPEPPGTETVDIEGRWADDRGKSNSIAPEASLEVIEKFIDKAKKENKEDMIERNKDLLKKSTTW